MPILEIVSPHALVLAAIRIVESTLAVSETKAPVSNVTIAKKLVIAVGPFEPDVSTEATLVVVLPVSSVLLIRREPVHGALTVTFIDSPLPLIIVARLVRHPALSTLHSLLPVPIIHRAISILKCPLAVSESSNPLTLIHDPLLRVSICAPAVSQPVDDLALEEAAVGPVVPATTRDLVLPELPLILRPILPYKLALAVQETVLHLTLEDVALAELTRALPVVNLANLKGIRDKIKYNT
jgi:hypothetical protein